MAIELRHGTKVWHRRERSAQFATWAAWLAGAAIFIYCWKMISDKTIWAFVWDAPQQAADLGARMVPPDWGSIRNLGQPIWDTLNTAFDRYEFDSAAAIIIVIIAIVMLCEYGSGYLRRWVR